MKVSKDCVSFDEMCWPLPNRRISNKMRYNMHFLTQSDCYHAASILEAFDVLVSAKTQKQILHILKTIRTAEAINHTKRITMGATHYDDY